MAKANPIDRRYTQEHEWVKDNGDGTVTMGITDHAQELLTDIVFIELPEIGRKAEATKQLAVVESVKSVSDVYAPVSGEVTKVNSELEDAPENINSDAFESGWICMIKMDDPSELDGLMDATAYEQMIKE